MVNNMNQSKFTLTKVLEVSSSTLKFLNKAIPLYTNTLPLINNTKTLIKGFVNSNKVSIKDDEEKEEIKEIKETKKESNSSITFFR